MPVISCPHCRKAISTAAALAGRKAKCPQCGTAFVLRVKGGPKLGTSPKQSVKPRRRLKLSLGVGAGLLVAVLITVGLRESPTPNPTQQIPASFDRPEQKGADALIATAETPSKPKVDPPPISVEEQIANLAVRLNEMRKAAQLPPVIVDADFSRGCQAHADYVATNLDHPKLAAVDGFQDEDPSLPGYREDGKKAARASLLATAEPGQALELWFGRIQSRPPLLHPDLERIGIGAAKAARGGWITVLDASRGRGVNRVAFPAPGQRNVPLNFSGGPEADAYSGFPISLQFPPGQQFVTLDTSLTDDLGNRVPALISTPAQPLKGVSRAGLIGLIPRQPLSGNSTYHVRIACQWDERTIVTQWEFRTEDDGDEDGAWRTKMLERLNRIRRQADLTPVELDDVLSHGCRLHVKYLNLNAGRPEVQGLGAHEEDPKLPGYTIEGAKAGKASDIAIGDFEPTHSLDGWMATLYHRVPILEPGLRKVGFGCIRGQGLGWITALDVLSDRSKSPRPRPVFWPVEGQSEVPLHFPPGGETPNPIPDDKTGRAGYPITATFPHHAPLLNAQAKLEDATGQPVACWFSSPEAPANPRFERFQGTTVCLIPKEPLRPEQNYRITITGSVMGAAWKKTWTFTSAKLGPTSSDAVQLATMRINQVRTTAGLPEVRLDTDLSKKCQAQADELARDKISEAPPHFVAGSNAVYLRAPRPSTQIDDLMGTLQRRSFLLDPRLRRIGLGCAFEEGRGWVNVLDLNSGRDDGPPVVFPGDGQANVPLQGRDRLPGDAKSLTGYPITVWFPGPPVAIRNARATLTEAAGAPIDLSLSTPEFPFDRGVPQPNVIAIHPLQPLRPGRRFSVSITAQINGMEWRNNGSFTTADYR